jgi:hypothetical protein
MKIYKLRFNKDFYFFKRKNKDGGYDINFILYSKRRLDERDVYVFLKKEENVLEIDYMGSFVLRIENLTKDFIKIIDDKSEIYITEIDPSKKVKPLSYLGKILK